MQPSLDGNNEDTVPPPSPPTPTTRTTAAAAAAVTRTCPPCNPGKARHFRLFWVKPDLSERKTGGGKIWSPKNLPKSAKVDGSVYDFTGQYHFTVFNVLFQILGWLTGGRRFSGLRIWTLSPSLPLSWPSRPPPSLATSICSLPPPLGGGAAAAAALFQQGVPSSQSAYSSFCSSVDEPAAAVAVHTPPNPSHCLQAPLHCCCCWLCAHLLLLPLHFTFCTMDKCKGRRNKLRCVPADTKMPACKQRVALQGQMAELSSGFATVISLTMC
eukprot:1156036-Pelagomonas_calceolata.AAC.2